MRLIGCPVNVQNKREAAPVAETPAPAQPAAETKAAGKPTVAKPVAAKAIGKKRPSATPRSVQPARGAVAGKKLRFNVPPSESESEGGKQATAAKKVCQFVYNVCTDVYTVI